MKIKELIKLLEKEDPEMRVVLAGYEGGLNDVYKLEKLKIRLDANSEWYYGTHEEVFNEEDPFDEVALQIR